MRHTLKAVWTFLGSLAFTQGLIAQQGLLWRITGHGHSGFVYGTMHTSDSIANSMDSTVYNALYNCKSLLLEGDLGAVPDMAMMMNLMRMPNQTLDSLYTPSELLEVNTFLEANLDAMGMLMKDQLLPVFTLFMIQQREEMERSNVSQSELLETAMDMRFHQLAVAHQLQTVGLESWAEQIGKVAAIDLKTQAQLLLETARGKQFKNIMIADVVTSYYRQDLTEMAGILDPNDRLQMAFFEAILYQRNDRFVERALPYFERENTFMAVGALHLAGERGVLAQLREQGYKVEHVPFSFLNYKPTN